MAYFTGKVTKKGIYHLSDYVHVVDGKIICFESSLYDVNNPDDVNASVCILHDFSKNGEKRFMPHVVHFNVLSGEHRKIVEKAISDLYGKP